MIPGKLMFEKAINQEEEILLLRSKIRRLNELGDELASPMNIAGMYSCPRCFVNKFDCETRKLIHNPNCPVDKWFQERGRE